MWTSVNLTDDLAHQDCSLGVSTNIRKVDSCFLIYSAHAIVTVSVHTIVYIQVHTQIVKFLVSLISSSAYCLSDKQCDSLFTFFCSTNLQIYEAVNPNLTCRKSKPNLNQSLILGYVRTRTKHKNRKLKYVILNFGKIILNYYKESKNYFSHLYVVILST